MSRALRLPHPDSDCEVICVFSSCRTALGFIIVVIESLSILGLFIMSIIDLVSILKGIRGENKGSQSDGGATEIEAEPGETPLIPVADRVEHTSEGEQDHLLCQKCKEEI